MKISSLYGKVKKAIKDYDLIGENDKVAVGISGGKDSLALLYALKGISMQKDMNFSIHPVMVSMGFENFDTSMVEAFCKNLGLDLTIIHTQLANLIFEERKEKNPCSLCSTMRRGILNKNIKKIGCNKLALGHHQKDMITTAMMNLLYNGKYESISPMSFMSDAEIHLIRPLIYVKEEEIISLVDSLSLPVISSPCPVDKITKRRATENLLDQIEKDVPGAEDRIFTALKNTNFLKG